MTAPEIALAVFTLCNTVRIFAYIPQIIRIGQDTTGAAAISYGTWAMFGFSHVSTVFYAAVAVGDLVMAAVFAGNTCCCAAIIGLTVWKRARFERPAAPSVTRQAPVAVQRHGVSLPQAANRYTAPGLAWKSQRIAPRSGLCFTVHQGREP